MIKTKIDWCNSTYNPISGCKHHCEYCYARRIAERFAGCTMAPHGITSASIITIHERMHSIDKNGVVRNAAYPFGFTPTLHEYRLEDPKTKGFGKNVFVCSTADMFGRWVPDEWITKVFQSCEAADGHRYLFLTKNPVRYIYLAEKGLLPKNENFWYGSTVTDDSMPAFYAEGYNTFVSIEPVLAPFESGDNGIADKVDWAIIGAETGNRKNKVVPDPSWITSIANEFKKRGKPVFMKESLEPILGYDIMKEFPWED